MSESFRQPNWVIPMTLAAEQVHHLVANPRVVVLITCGEDDESVPFVEIGTFQDPEATFHSHLSIQGAPRLATKWRKTMECAERQLRIRDD